MKLIYEYSPFKNQQEIFEQFSMITGETGTMVVNFGLELYDGIKPCLDITTDLTDIRMTNFKEKKYEKW
jgi:hypothetical protein